MSRTNMEENWSYLGVLSLPVLRSSWRSRSFSIKKKRKKKKKKDTVYTVDREHEVALM